MTTLPSQNDVQAFYDRTYRDQGLADPQHIYRRIIRLLYPLPRQQLLDVACGEGHLLYHAQQAGLTATGVDVSFEAIRRSQRRCPGARLAVGAGEQLPFADEAFDYVTSLGSLEHYRDMDAGVREMARVLKPDGLACIMVPNVFWLGDVLEVMGRGECSSGFQIIERHGTRRGWQRFFEGRGLAVEGTFRYNKPYPLWTGPGWKIKSVRKFLWRRFFNAVCPFNLSLEFMYLCRKAPPAPSSTGS